MTKRDVAVDAARFVKDIAAHGLTVMLDSGLYRHLRFRKPSDSNWIMWFDIVTWPGNLTIRGDMGTWSFSRLEDMFAFFRSDQLRINASYWSEKIISESRFGGPSERFMPEVFKANVLSALDGYDLSDTRKAEIIEALDGDVFVEDDEATARRALAHFKCEEFMFSNPWEIGGQGYGYHYLWCLYAIVWGIQQYDARGASEAPATNTPASPEDKQDGARISAKEK